MNDKSLKRLAAALYAADYHRHFDNAPDFKFADLSEKKQANYVALARHVEAMLQTLNFAGGGDDVA